MKLLLLALCLLITPRVLAQPTPATTAEGRDVMLLDDGTWHYVEVSLDETDTATDRPASATKLYRGKRVSYGLWLDPAKWVETSAVSEDADYSFVHADGDVYATLIAERIYFPPEAMKEIAVLNAENALSDIEATDEGSLTVNDVEVFRFKMTGKMQGLIPMAFFGQYHVSEDVGSIQLVIFTSSNLLDDYQADLENLMSGFVLLDAESGN